jgi:hypothetical protein
MTTLCEKLEKLKLQFITTDAFGDNADELLPVYTDLIDSIGESKNKIMELNQIKEQFYIDDLFYSDEDEIKQSKIFIIQL